MLPCMFGPWWAVGGASNIEGMGTVSVVKWSFVDAFLFGVKVVTRKGKVGMEVM